MLIDSVDEEYGEEVLPLTSLVCGKCHCLTELDLIRPMVDYTNGVIYGFTLTCMLCGGSTYLTAGIAPPMFSMSSGKTLKPSEEI